MRNVSVTATCGACGGPVPAGREGVGARMRADKPRSGSGAAAPRPAQPAKADTVYECPECEARSIGSQRCEVCNRWCRRLGPGGPCPHCDEVVVLGDFLSPGQLSPPPPRSSAKQPRTKERP